MARLIARRDACPNFNEAATPSVVHCTTERRSFESHYESSRERDGPRSDKWRLPIRDRIQKTSPCVSSCIHRVSMTIRSDDDRGACAVAEFAGERNSAV